MPTHDAYGRDVRELTPCAKCFTLVKYAFPFEGKFYGSTCIKAVSGIEPEFWVKKNGQYNYEATLAAIEAKNLQLAMWCVESAAREARIAKDKATRLEKFGELINILKASSQHRFDFCWDMAEIIQSEIEGESLQEIFSYRQLDIVQDIWAKYHGRRNSKAYKAALLEFESKWGNQLQEA